MKKIVFIAPGNSVHTWRWMNALIKTGLDLVLITMHAPQEKYHPKIKIILLPVKTSLGYYLNAFKLKKLLKRITPDLIHTHYASGYGTLIRLTNPVCPVILTAWGSDVFEYPQKNFINKSILKKNLKSASLLTVASKALKDELKKYSQQKVIVIPFGIDVSCFSPGKKRNQHKVFTIGIVKTMHPTYGIDILLKTIKRLTDLYPGQIKGVFAGGGSYLKKYQKMAQDLNIDSICKFYGQIPHTQVAQVLKKLDVYCAFSRQESFGVSILEACACGIPVVVSQAPGLKEIVRNKVNGLILKKLNEQEACKQIEKLMHNISLRNQLISNGRKMVIEKYNWKKNVSQMKDLYHSIVLSTVAKKIGKV